MTRTAKVLPKDTLGDRVRTGMRKESGGRNEGKVERTSGMRRGRRGSRAD